jgi:hypothetical protein
MIERELLLWFLRVVEEVAIEAVKTWTAGGP